MNPVEEGNNQFAELFKAMPAARIGKMEDIAGAILYLSSTAGVSRLPSLPQGGSVVANWKDF